MTSAPLDHLRDLPVLQRFYQLARNLFGVSVFMLSPDGAANLCLGSRRSAAPFCRALQKQAGKSRCRQCDRLHLARCLAGGQPLRYRCFAGLTEFMIPITLEGEIVAFLQCGQILDVAPSAKSWRAASRKLISAGVDPSGLRPSYMRTRVVGRTAQGDLIALLELISDYVIRTQRELLLSARPRDSQIVNRARRYVRQHLGDGVSLDAVAAAACTSKRNLCRVFRAKTGQTVIGYLQAQRVAMARDRLVHSTDSCAEIAFACGFGSVQQFNRVFRTLERATPSQVRRRTPRRASRSSGLSNGSGVTPVS